MTGGPEDGRAEAAGPAALAADPRLATLWVAAHRRLEATGSRVGGAAVHLRDLPHEERAAVDRLLGARSRGEAVRIPLDRLDALLRERAGCSLVDVVTAAVGPVRDRPGERAAREAGDGDLWERLLAHPALHGRPELAGWLAAVRAGGRWRRLQDPARDLAGALDVLGRLPLPHPAGRARLAAEILGHAHALDDGSPVGRLVLAALAYRAGRTGRLPAADRRSLLAAQGVVSDETSSTVLTLGLRPAPAGPLTRAASGWADGQVPLPVPLAAVQSERWRVRPGSVVWVCENPSVPAAAAGLPVTVVCLEGQPSVAAVLLLRTLAGGGARLRYHGDFGAGGITIANQVVGDLGAEPWRFRAADHREALARVAGCGTTPQPLRGPVPDARWDPDLAPAVRACGVEIEEELVMDLLLEDLRRSA